MVKKLILNDTLIHLCSYEEEIVDGLYKISVDFKVTSNDYHDISTLLYNGTFDVKIPERDLIFRGTIHTYSTSITNLYIKDQIGEYKLVLMEVSQ
ncbi:DUF3219 family protein [Cytobacillus depressus]|uniref:DUF3219 family protein n=1 Tax=Cytobacillus depressus TaxID=1602942 RepID=A0A6L3V0W2_9BACI|nr:DUF3219 family protein [Cytobacillus depressus]KAB2329730.1 DUF3219 family protein [Cytobacillus depressus]